FFQAEDGIRDFHVTGVQTLLFRSQKWKKSSIGRTFGCAASRITASVDGSVARCVDVRANSIIAVRPKPRVISPTSRMQSGVAARSEERRVGKECRCRWAAV